MRLLRTPSSVSHSVFANLFSTPSKGETPARTSQFQAKLIPKTLPSVSQKTLQHFASSTAWCTHQEATNTIFFPSHERFNTAIVHGVGNVSEKLRNPPTRTGSSCNTSFSVFFRLLSLPLLSDLLCVSWNIGVFFWVLFIPKWIWLTGTIPLRQHLHFDQRAEFRGLCWCQYMSWF